MATDIALPESYGRVLEDLKQRVKLSQVRVRRRANNELVRLYYSIGHTILEHQEEQGWGAGVIERLAPDLSAAFAGVQGFSPTNLRYMRAAALAWPDQNLPQAVGELPWGHVRARLDRLDTTEDRNWYAAAAVEQGWSRNVLLDRIKARTRQRIGAAPSNFSEQLTGEDSDLAVQLARDPYVFDFLGLTQVAAERDLEQAIVDKLEHTLLELGDGFAFVGRQKHFVVDGDDFYIDLLFFHTTQLRYVVIELKIGKFEPSFAGQLGFYVALVDDRLRLPTHAPTVGILLCTDRNEAVVRYSLGATPQPVAVSTYTYDLLPEPEQQALPSAEALTRAIAVEHQQDEKTDGE
ncbi:PDDEXK nuclease domain-containing protein [Leifsonia sp. McL0607]|uniref:PDDEXK nuclease domain-containing protein n=1 Tax=Leifsonia sp. McL0607 TaxID=3415672 RepID=UPI003CF96F95